MEKKTIKIFKYGIGILVFGIFAYHSVYFRLLDKMGAVSDLAHFDSKAYTLDFWQNKLPTVTGRAVDAADLLDLFEHDMDQAIEKYARTLGIASQHSYLVKGEGRVVEIDEDGIRVRIDGDSGAEVLITTIDLFGNAVRDASGLVDVSDFPNTMEFNTISVEINTIIRTEVVRPAVEKAAVGKNIRFIGAAEVSEDDQNIHPLKIIPIEINLKE